MSLHINVFNDSGIKYLPKKKIIDIIINALRKEKVNEAVISIIYVNDEQIIRLNREYLKHDYYTDVIAFDLGEKVIEGEIYICIDRAKIQAEEFQVTLDNEIARLAVHGTLHLLGYDDSNDSKRNTMNKLETKYISC